VSFYHCARRLMRMISEEDSLPFFFSLPYFCFCGGGLPRRKSLLTPFLLPFRRGLELIIVQFLLFFLYDLGLLTAFKDER